MTKAFSLIELLVVMAIIAILAVMAPMFYMKYISNARYAKMETLSQQVNMYQEQYFADYDSYDNFICDALNLDQDYLLCNSVKVPKGFKIESQAISCPAVCGGGEGFKTRVETKSLKDSTGAGNAILIYSSCYDAGGTCSAGLICVDNDIHGKIEKISGACNWP
ncbi:type IV pilin protein [Thermodesulfatator indicus]